MGSQQQWHSVPSHCFGAAILASWVFLATNGQSAAVALCSITLFWGSHFGKLGLLGNKWAVSSSGTLFHHTVLGQPFWQAGSSWQQMGSQQQWQHNTCHQGSSTSQHRGSSHLGTQFHHTA